MVMATKVNVKSGEAHMSTPVAGIVIVAVARSVICPVTGAMPMTVVVLGTMPTAVATTMAGTMSTSVAGRMPAAVIGAVAMPMTGASVRIAGLQICWRENSEASGNRKDKEELFHDDDGVGFCVELLPQQGGVIIRRSGALPYSSTSNVFCDMQDKREESGDERTSSSAHCESCNRTSARRFPQLSQHSAYRRLSMCANLNLQSLIS